MSCTSVRMTLGNATFRESVEVERVNDLQMDLLITLSTKQFIPVDGLRCTNITAGDFQILGRINGHTLDDIYGDTFTVQRTFLFFISDLEIEREREKCSELYMN